MQKHKTKVVEKSLKPEWNESVSLSVPEPAKFLSFKVYDKDKMSADDSMGEFHIELLADGQVPVSGLQTLQLQPKAGRKPESVSGSIKVRIQRKL